MIESMVGSNQVLEHTWAHELDSNTTKPTQTTSEPDKRNSGFNYSLIFRYVQSCSDYWVTQLMSHFQKFL